MLDAVGADLSGTRAIVLAAGYGSRLAPVTDHLPKPLLPVRGRPLLDIIIERILQAGIGPVAVNSHHLGGLVAAHLDHHARTAQLVHFPETEILGTGGALANARDFLGAGPHFLVHNGDVLCDADLTQLVAAHVARGALATLLLVDWPAVNSVTVSADGAVRHFGGVGEPPVGQPDDRQLTYAGIGVFQRELLSEIGPGFSSLITPLAAAARTRPGSVQAFVQPTLAWDDLGTLGRWLNAAEGDAQTGDGFELTRITGHGSDRRFWRLGRQGWSAVAMADPHQDDEFERFVAVARFLHDHELGAPELLSVDESCGTLLMEDVGSASLLALATRPDTPPAVLADAYHRVVDHLLALQNATGRARSECPAAVDRVFDLAQLRWETDYFRERFLQGHLGWSGQRCAELEGEYEALARSVAALPQTLMHRDFQSQNILLQTDRVRLVDFQGLRLGPFTYDLASLVWDPYVKLPDALRVELVARFAAGCGIGDAETVVACTVGAGLQRVMQALGAFGFLGHCKGKPGFLAHIPTGVAHLRQLLDQLAPRAGNGPWPPAMPVLTRFMNEVASGTAAADSGDEHD